MASDQELIEAADALWKASFEYLAQSIQRERYFKALTGSIEKYSLLRWGRPHLEQGFPGLRPAWDTDEIRKEQKP